MREHFGGTFLLARNLATRGFLTFCVCEHFGGTILFGWNLATGGFVTLGECVFPEKAFCWDGIRQHREIFHNGGGPSIGQEDIHKFAITYLSRMKTRTPGAGR